MTIVQAIQTIALACTNKIVAFSHGEKWEQNLQDENTIFPLIVLDHPITGKDKILPQGNQETTYSLGIFFCNRSSLDYTQAQHQVILDAMYLIKREFVTRCHNSSLFKGISSVKTTELINQWDLNVTGVFMNFDIEVSDHAATCDLKYIVDQDGLYVVDSNGNKILVI